MPLLTPIEPHEPPCYFETRKRYQDLGSLIMLNDSVIAADDSLKSIIERREPGVHRFYPIEIRMPKGEAFARPFYTLVIGQYFDSFSPENSKPTSWEKNGDYAFRYVDRKSDMAGLAFSSAIFGHAHLWRERRGRAALTLLSDQLMADINQADLQLPKTFKMKEV